MLSLNPKKTEIVHFHSRFSHPVLILKLNEHYVPISKKARSVGVIFDRLLTMSSHANSICSLASLALRSVGRVRKYLYQTNTERLIHAFISSRLDYCNSLLYGLPAKENKDQRTYHSFPTVRAWGKDLTLFKNVQSNSLPTGISFQSNATKFPQPGLHIAAQYPKAEPKKF